MIQNYINHVVFVLDESGSMQGRNLVDIFENQIKYLAQRSRELNQETRASVYLFNTKVRCIAYDIDVLRLPSIRQHYKPDMQTSLIDGTLKAIEDLKLTPELYGDHAFLLYVLSDGMENYSKNSAGALSKIINSLPENWTVAALVPDQNAVFESKKFGFPANNIQIWNANSQNMDEVDKKMSSSTEQFFKARASGTRGTKNLFALNTSALSSTVVKKKLKEIDAKDYELLPVHKEAVIKPFVESWTGKTYRPGSAFYMLTKPEKVQAYKQVCIQEKMSGKVYTGQNARDILGLPDQEVKISAATHNKYDIFLQSSSLNRKLVAGTKLLVIK